MAHQLGGAATFRLHQALHGYVDGHRQLALSTPVKPHDQRTLLALSDISGPGAKLDESGYLTGYPLPDSALFALARTWPAPELPRPGCVWTHTLLVDFADLAVMTSLSGLLSLFRKPTGSNDFPFYGKPEQLELTSREDRPLTHHDWMRRVLGALYGKPKGRIIVGDPGPGADRTILAIWSQQWPRLRRSFRFCTFAPGDRSIEGAAFDLQVLPARDRGLRNRFGDAVDADHTGPESAPWIDIAIRDLLDPDVDGLKSFLRRVGSDVAGGREAFRPLCRLHQLVSEIRLRPEAVGDAIAVVQRELGPSEARTARVVVASAALQRAAQLDDRSFDFLWSQLPLLESDNVTAHASAVGHAAWVRDPSLLLTASVDAPVMEAILDSTLDTLGLSDLMDGLRTVPTLAERALARRQELVELPDFWRYGSQDEGALQIATSSGRQRGTVKAILAAGRDDIAARAAGAFGSRETLAALKGLQDPHDQILVSWLRAAGIEPNSVGEFLASEPGIHRAVLCVLARLLPPDAVPNDYGPDPWLIALRSSSGMLDEKDSAYVAAYILSRALGFRSRSEADLAQMSFERVHSAAERAVLPEEAWRIVEPRLPWLDWWSAWDRCHRLRTAIVEFFVERSLEPDTFARLVESNELFNMLLKVAARTGRGRAYLERVEHSMKKSSVPAAGDRLLMLERLLG